jgi:Cdc6-like AAA superfamily ATPase
MITARAVGGPANPEKIEEMDRELTKVIEDFNHAVDVEALRLAKKNGKHLLPLPGDHSISVARVEQEFLLTRLKRVETGYDLKLCCMERTRETLLNQIMAWAANESDTSNLYWIHGLPGIGKTSLAHSICERLHSEQRLAGAFFARGMTRI